MRHEGGCWSSKFQPSGTSLPFKLSPMLFASQFVKVFYRKFCKIISSQTPGFFNDTQLGGICFHPTDRSKKEFLLLSFLGVWRSKRISQTPSVSSERRGRERPGLRWLLVSTCLSQGVTAEVLNHTHATTMVSTGHLSFLDDKKENTQWHKNDQKVFTESQFSFPQKKKKIQNERIVGVVTPLDIPIHPIAYSL